MAKMNQHFTRSECTLDGELAFENSDILSLSSQFSLLIPLKTSCFQRDQNGTLGRKGLMITPGCNWKFQPRDLHINKLC